MLLVVLVNVCHAYRVSVCVLFVVYDYLAYDVIVCVCLRLAGFLLLVCVPCLYCVFCE